MIGSLEEVSEKDMIGSLLEDEECGSPNQYDKLNTNSSHHSQYSFPKVSNLFKSVSKNQYPQKSIYQLIKNEMHDNQYDTTIPSGSDTKQQEIIQYEFPSIVENQQNFYLNIHQQNLSDLPQITRPHSFSSEDYYFNQFYQSNNMSNQNFLPQVDFMNLNQSYTPQFSQPRQRFQGQDSYFSQKRHRKIPQADIINDGHLIQKCQDQHASLQLQQQFEGGSEHQRDKIFQALEPEFPSLSKHPFGNYVIQKIVEKGNPQQRQIIFDRIQNFILEMSFDKYGCRVIQKILEFIVNKPNQQQIFISAIKPKILNLIFDPCGNHVVQKMIDQINMNHTEFILRIVELNVDQIVSHSYGCRIVQKCLELYASEQLQHLYNILIPLINKLSFCSYGNYIVQHMINDGPKHLVIKIKEFILQNIVEVCRDKFASNVAQKFIQKSENVESFGDQILNNQIGIMQIKQIFKYKFKTIDYNFDQ